MKYVGKSNITLKRLVDVFGMEAIKSLGKFYYKSGCEYDIFTRRREITSYIGFVYGTDVMVMTSGINIQYSVDLDSLSIGGREFSIRLLKDLLDCKSLEESLLKVCHVSVLMKKTLENANIPSLEALSIRIRSYHSPTNYEIELWFHPNTSITLTGSAIICKKRDDFSIIEKDCHKIANWIENEI